MKEKPHFPKLGQAIEKRRKRRRKVLLMGLIGILALYFIPKAIFLAATKRSKEVMSTELPQDQKERLNKSPRRKNTFTVYLSKDEYVWVKGKHQDSSKQGNLVIGKIQNWLPQVEKKGPILIMKPLEDSEYASLTRLLDSVIRYPAIKYALEKPG